MSMASVFGETAQCRRRTDCLAYGINYSQSVVGCCIDEKNRASHRDCLCVEALRVSLCRNVAFAFVSKRCPQESESAKIAFVQQRSMSRCFPSLACSVSVESVGQCVRKLA